MEAFLQSLKLEDLNNQRYVLYQNAKEYIHLIESA
jgi:hypothetical protein